MLMKFFRETKAYTSIFLCLVLLPMVTYSTMIIDASRLQSARVEVQSAGDLALNAGLSEYEKVLEDMYGLFANAESLEEVEPAIQHYFEETISAAIEKPGGGSYSAKLAEQLTDYVMKYSNYPDGTEFTNFLNMKLEDSSDELDPFTFQPVTNSAISNTDILKGQIVDYMKYKGPVSLGSNFLNKLGFLKDTPAQSNAIQSKIELTQEIAKVNEEGQMDNAIEAIEKYNNACDRYNNPETGKGYSGDWFYTDVMKDMQSDLNIISKCILFNLVLIELNKELQNYDSLDTSVFYNDSDENYKTPADKNDKGELLGTEENLKNTREKLDDISEKIDALLSEKSFYTLDEYKFPKTIEDEKVTEVNVELVGFGYTDEYNKLANLSSNASEPNDWQHTPFENWENYFNMRVKDIYTLDQIKDSMAKFKAYHIYLSTLCAAYDDRFTEYEQIYDKIHEDEEEKPDILQDSDYQWYLGYKKYSDILEEQCNPNTCKEKYDQLFNSCISGSAVFINVANGIYFNRIKKFNEYRNFVLDMITYLTNANEKLNYIYSQAESIENKANSIKGEDIQKIGDEATKAQMTSDIDTLSKSIDKEEVGELQKVLEVYIGRFEKVKKGLNEVSYVSVPIKDITNTNSLEDKSNAYYAALNTTKLAELKTDLNPSGMIWENFHYPYLSGRDNVLDDDKPKPEISNDAEKITGIPENEVFYNVLKNTKDPKKPDKNEESTQKNEQQLDSIKKFQDVDTDGNPADETAQKNVDALKKKDETDDKKKEEVSIAEGLFGTEKDFQDAYKELKCGESESLGSAGDGSIPSEGAKSEDAKEDARKGKENLKNATNILSQIATVCDHLKDDVYMEEYFTEMFTCLTDKKLDEGKLQMLNGYTNNPTEEKFLNPKNAWYGSEIEYILWGSNDLEKNLNTTAASIFLIRFVINAIYAFTAPDIQEMASSVAGLLVGWTVVLVPVVQVCITLGVALAESALDVQMLKDGKDVVLLKDDSTFICSPKGLANNAAEMVDKAVNKVTDYVGDKVDDCIDNAINTGKEKIKDCVDDIANAAKEYTNQQQKNITSKIKSQITTPIINTITPAISKLNKANDNAKNLVEPAIAEAFSTIKSNIDSMEDSLVKEFSERAYKKILPNENIEENKTFKDLVKIITDEIKEETISIEEISTAIDKKISGLLGDKDENNPESEYTGLFGDLKNKIDEEAETVKNDIIDKHGKEAAKNLKGYFHEGMDSLSQKFSQKASEGISDTVSQLSETNSLKKKSTTTSGKLTMNYKEYCKIFVFIGLLTDENEARMLQRAAVLMQLNVNYAVKGGSEIKSAGTKDFKMNNAYTLFYVKANVKMGTLFPWAVDFEENGTNSETKLDFTNLGTSTVNLTYSGIAGY